MTTLKTRLARFGGLVVNSFAVGGDRNVLENLAGVVVGVLLVAVIGPIALVGVVVCGK